MLPGKGLLMGDFKIYFLKKYIKIIFYRFFFLFLHHYIKIIKKH